MGNGSSKVMSLASALAALTGTAAIVPQPVGAEVIDPNATTPVAGLKAPELNPNRIVSLGEDLLGFTVTKAADGTVLADHYSHYSHSSHASHSSHYSSRY